MIYDERRKYVFEKNIPYIYIYVSVLENKQMGYTQSQTKQNNNINKNVPEKNIGSIYIYIKKKLQYNRYIIECFIRRRCICHWIYLLLVVVIGVSNRRNNNRP